MTGGRFVQMGVVAGTLLVFGNELLGLFEAIRFWPVVGLWVLLTGLGVYTWRSLPGRVEPGEAWRNLGPVEKGTLSALFVLLLLTFISGLFSPPNSWDSMTFHLPRQVRWIQQASLAHFPTHIKVQLYRGPFSEIVQANLQILTRTDMVTQLVSWVAVLGCGCLVGLLCVELKTGRRMALLAALAAVAIPGAFLEASTTKNDLVVAVWSLTAVWLTLRALVAGTIPPSSAILLGLSLGLATLSKSTAYLLLFPLQPFIVVLLWRQGIRKAVPAALLIAVSFAAVNFGYWQRNWREFGGPLGPPERNHYHANEEMSVARALSRIVKESSLHLGSPWQEWNRFWEDSIESFHDRIGVPILDPATTYPDRPWRILFEPGNEYHAGAPLHFAAFLGLPLLGLLLRRHLPRFWWMIASMPWGIFLLLSLLTRWEPYLNTRLHILMLLLAIPPAAAILKILGDGLQRTFQPADSVLAMSIAVLLILQVFPSAWRSPRSAFGPVFRTEKTLLFVQGWHLKVPYEACAKEVRRLRPGVVGLDSRGDWSWEYPLMRLVRDDLATPRFVSVNTGSSREAEEPVPDVVIVFREVDSLKHTATGKVYEKAYGEDFLTILVLQE